MPIKPMANTGRRPILDGVRTDDNSPKRMHADLLVGGDTPRQCSENAHGGVERRHDGEEVRELGLNGGILAHVFVDGLAMAMYLIVVLATQDIFENPRHGHILEPARRGADEDDNTEDEDDSAGLLGRRHRTSEPRNGRRLSSKPRPVGMGMGKPTRGWRCGDEGRLLGHIGGFMLVRARRRGHRRGGRLAIEGEKINK